MQIKNHTELESIARSLSILQKDSTFNCYLTSDKLVAYNLNKLGVETQEYFTYTFENSAIQKFFVDLLDANLTSSYTIAKTKTTFTNAYKFSVYCNKDNNYQFLMNENVLSLLLTAEDLKSQGISPTYSFKLKTKNKIRDIVAPRDEIKPMLRNINRIFQATYDSRNADFQVAYKSGKSIKNNAMPHANKKYVFKIDLHDFFPSCKNKYVIKYIQFLFKNSINSNFLINKFLDLITENGALYIGSPVSGTLANAIISRPVEYIKRICDKFDIKFTVYADDMTFSSDKFICKDFIINIFNRAFVKYDMENDFSLNEKKCYGESGDNRAITGVVINSQNKLTCHRHIFGDIRQTLHQLSYGDESHYVHNKLKGQISFMSMVDESKKLNNLVKKYETTIRKYNLMSEEKIQKMILEA